MADSLRGRALTGRHEIVTVIGASGFLGRYVVQTLAQAGYRIRAVQRHPNRALFLRPLGWVGQIELVRGYVADEAALRRAILHSDAVVNLVGILYEEGSQRFETVQAEGAERIARIAAEAGIGAFVQVSAIGARRGSASAYAATKARGEAAVRAAVPSARILRPSILFGPEDDFFNRFADMARYSPVLPLIGGGRTRFQPAYVADVARAVLGALTLPSTAGRIFELGGQRIYTFRELMELILRVTHRKRLLLPLPFPLATIIAALAQMSPTRLLGMPPLLTTDQVELLKADNVVGASGEAVGTFADLGVPEPSFPEAVVASYLWRFRKDGQFGDQPFQDAV
ncbi:MAG: complex I NDUFA9 subunit family protein [Alphaproteobacteria bacterium]|nr:complex I NDUFA9 subunit family protein [Alphaproteobacteria bacterium]